jgi:hypothetical protein
MGNEAVAGVIHQYQARGREASDHELIDVLMDRVIDQYVMVGIAEDLNAALRVLAAVRQFDVVFLQRLLGQLVPEFKDLREALFLEVLSRLSGTYLVEWDRVRKGYALDITLRRILALRLRYNRQPIYLEANQIAATLYDDWIERVPENRSVYVVERLYHQACIALAADKSVEQPVTDLEEKLQGYLQRYYCDKDRTLAQRATDQLFQELSRDDELQEMLGDEFETLTKSVKVHLDSLKK